MAPDPKCAALAAALKNKGISYAQLGQKIGKSEQHVTDLVTGKTQATDAEFKSLATALGIADVPHTGVHATA